MAALAHSQVATAPPPPRATVHPLREASRRSRAASVGPLRHNQATEALRRHLNQALEVRHRPNLATALPPPPRPASRRSRVASVGPRRLSQASEARRRHSQAMEVLLRRPSPATADLRRPATMLRSFPPPAPQALLP